MVARGTLLVLISQVAFIASSFIINFGLSRILGPEDYGTFGIIMSTLLIVELFVIAGIPETIQKFGGENPGAMRKLKEKTLPWQLLYCVLLMGLFFFVAPLISEILNDHMLTFYLRVACLDIFFAGMYRYYTGLQNGLHHFSHYMIIGITFAVGKLAAIFVLVFLGFSLTRSGASPLFGLRLRQ